MTTALAALGAIAVPVGLVAATAGAPIESSTATSSEASATNTSFLEGQLGLVQARANAEAVRFQPQAAPAQPVVIETTTTAAPPTTAAPTITAAPAPAPAPAPEPEPEPAATGGGYGDPADPATWDRLAQCEASGNWATNTGNGYYGGLQFSLSSWEAVGGTGYPHQASRATQIEMGQRLHAQGGWGHWPGCARQLGYL
jgi:hypothetical protein